VWYVVAYIKISSWRSYTDNSFDTEKPLLGILVLKTLELTVRLLNSKG